ncbi:hypothetical protein EL22_10650 [Halostagnicola sp. A56]|uniref:hypothetical protein n=1 Tax=Halostagnicola sp. A56 TaxID=1495067 RepID=UPI00049F9C58|nr:hypothetical protein [Halostagnicola sp. A56]KDE57655.1 hypothetical protein EL22_10650 [Halostagnicola sp. A56]
MVERWQYPWIGLALLTFALGIVGQIYYEMGIISLYPVFTGLGILIIAARPEKFGYVMAGLGALSLVTAVLLDGWSPLTRGILFLVGVGTVIGGIRSQQGAEA